MKELSEYFNRHDKFIIAGHKEPDGDCIGSMLALKRFLNKLGKEAVILFEEEINIPIKELGIEQEYYTRHNLPDLEGFSSLVLLDAHQWYRMGKLESILRPIVREMLCIDHHPNNTGEGMIHYIDSSAAAVGEIIFDLICEMGQLSLMDTLIARAIYLSIYSDTGGFKFSNTSKKTHEMVARLFDYDIDPYHLYNVLNEQRTLPQMRLLAKVLESLRLVHQDKIGYLVVSKDMLDSTRTTIDDIRNFSYYPRSINSVRIAIVFTEKEELIDIAFRSKGDIAVNEIARTFGGGGHPNAAGAEVTGMSLEELIVEVLHVCQNALLEKEKSLV